MKRNLEETLQALYDSEINVTITMLWDGGFDFVLCSYMEPAYNNMSQPGWHQVGTAADLADALHAAAMKRYPTSDYTIKALRAERAETGSNVVTLPDRSPIRD